VVSNISVNNFMQVKA